MEIGQIVDYCIEWNRINEDDETDPKKKKKSKARKRVRKAKQADWDAFLG